MLSAISRKLGQIEKETKENTKQLANLRQLLGLDRQEETTDDGELGEIGRTAGGPLKTLLLRHEGRIRTTEFRLNGVCETSAKQSRELVELRYKLQEAMAAEADDFDDNGKIIEDELGQDFAYNPMAPEFKPRRPDVCSSGLDGVGRIAELTDASTPPGVVLCQASDVAATPIGYSLNDQKQRQHQHQQRQQCSSKSGFSVECREGVVADVTPTFAADGTNSELTTAIFRFDDINEELMFYKNLFFKLEIELKRKEELLQNMADALYDSPDRRYIQKRKWFEHKIRLLNQDKRRRGEAIGKLIRCIEDLKDRDRVDESLITEGRYAMQAALKTRGWPQEERIKTTVLSLEADRVHMKLQREAKSTPEQEEMPTENTDSNNNYAE